MTLLLESGVYDDSGSVLYALWRESEHTSWPHLRYVSELCRMRSGQTQRRYSEMSNYAACHATHYPKVESVARQKNARPGSGKEIAVRRSAKKRSTHTPALIRSRRARHAIRMAQFRKARAEMFGQRCSEERRAKEARIARHRKMLRCVVRKSSGTPSRRVDVSVARARYGKYLLRCVKRGKRNVFVPDYIRDRAQALQESCEGRHGKTFRKEGVPGFWTFLHSVPGDPSRAVFRDPAGISHMYLFEELAPHLQPVV